MFQGVNFVGVMRWTLFISYSVDLVGVENCGLSDYVKVWIYFV